MPTPGLTRILLRGYRTIREVEFRPRRVSALVGEAGTGKSNLLEAIRSLLDPGGAPLRAGDVAREGGDRIRLEGELADGTSLVVEGPGHPASHRGTVPCPISLPASLRTSDLVVAPADPSPSARKA